MEILSATESTLEYIGTIALLSVVTLSLAIIVGASLCVMITEKNFDLGGIVAIIVVLLIAAFTTLGLVNTFKQGAKVTYKATVSDFNEVYENGYEIIGQDSKLYILKKVDSNK